jgi:GNAT superfamily N-acetyltransferase
MTQEEWWHETHNPAAHARSVACTRGSVWQVGASNGCWCMYWRIGGAYRGKRSENKEALREIVNGGSPPGLLAFDGDLAVGWCQLTPRDALPWLDRMWWFQPVDDMPVWAISCFFVRKRYRLQGVMSQLIVAALKTEKKTREDVGGRSLPYRHERTEKHVEHLYWYGRGLHAGGLQGGCSPRIGSPDHAARSESNPAMRLLDCTRRPTKSVR